MKLIQIPIGLCFAIILFWLNICAAKDKNTHIVHIISGCGMAQDMKQAYNCLNSVSDPLEDLLSKMMFSNGLSNNMIHIEDSPDIQYPFTGIDSNNDVIIMVNHITIGMKENWVVSAVLAHELAHYYRGDIFNKQWVNISNELKADYFAGFWLHRNGCTDGDRDEIIAFYNKIPADKTHPPANERVKAVLQGWKDELVPFRLNNDTGAQKASNDAEMLKNYVDIFITVSPYVLTTWFINKHYDNKIKFHLVSKDIRVPTDSIINRIDRVTYLIDESHFKNKVLYPDNRANDNYGYLLTGVWNTFPVTCVIYFKDGSAMPILKQFSLSRSDNN